MNVRLAVEADIPQLIALAKESSSAAHWSEAQYKKVVSQADATNNGLALLAEEAIQTVGFVIARPIPGNEWEIENIVVAPVFQRSGIASQLLRELLLRAKAQNARRISLEVRASNVPAIGLYRKFGFVEAGRRRNYYANPSEDAVILELQLSA